jgi:hypothetical protein
MHAPVVILSWSMVGGTYEGLLGPFGPGEEPCARVVHESLGDVHSSLIALNSLSASSCTVAVPVSLRECDHARA